MIGAGPAGLTAALMLLRAGQRPLALEADGEVGGISRTVERDGWQFDLDGHRLFTRFDEVRDLCHEILTAEADSGAGRAAPTRPGADQGRR